MRIDNLTLAKISQDVYGGDNVRFTHRDAKLIVGSSTKKLHGIYQLKNVSKCVHPNEDFYAALYINFIQGKAEQAVIAFRGTMRHRIGNLIEDVVSWYGI